MMHKIELFVSSEKLEQFKKQIEQTDGGTVTNPIMLLQLMLQQECNNADTYASVVMDDGGNSMGDVFWDETVYENCYKESE